MMYSRIGKRCSSHRVGKQAIMMERQKQICGETNRGSGQFPQNLVPGSTGERHSRKSGTFGAGGGGV